MPTPCNESWNSMRKKDNGKHCSKCNTVVVDFINMTPEEIKIYLLNQPQRVCGNFHKRQVGQTENVLQKYLINTYNKSTKLSPNFFRNSILSLLGALLVLSGCNAIGKAAPEDDQKIDSIELTSVDTLKSQSDTLLKEKTMPDSTKNGL